MFMDDHVILFKTLAEVHQWVPGILEHWQKYNLVVGKKKTKYLYVGTPATYYEPSIQ